jgi:hypothetical protein
MSDTKIIEQKIALRLKWEKDPQQRNQIARELNALAKILIASYKEQKNGKR